MMHGLIVQSFNQKYFVFNATKTDKCDMFGDVLFTLYIYNFVFVSSEYIVFRIVSSKIYNT